jgi:hypothetical protein
MDVVVVVVVVVVGILSSRVWVGKDALAFRVKFTLWACTRHLPAGSG